VLLSILMAIWVADRVRDPRLLPAASALIFVATSVSLAVPLDALLAFEPLGGLETKLHRERVAVCEFEIDDQTGEDLALALDRLRDLDGVLDVSMHAMTGKKGRLAVHVRLLARIAAVESVLESCFRETTTLGVRWHEVSRAVLARASATVTVDGRVVRVKSAHRPGEVRTSKAEIDDLATLAGGHADRERVRAAAERTGENDAWANRVPEVRDDRRSCVERNGWLAPAWNPDSPRSNTCSRTSAVPRWR